MKYSRVYNYKYGDEVNNFRYNYDEHRLEYIYKPDAETVEELKDDAENCKLDWLKIEARENLKSYEETGYIVITSEGLRESSWKESRDYYMDMMSEDIACEVAANIY